MGLGRLNGSFSSVAAMDIKQDELELDVPFLFNDAHVVSTGSDVEVCKLMLWPWDLRRFMIKE